MRYGIIHAAMGSVAPLKEAILELEPDAKVVNFVNEEMLAYANRTGKVDETAMRMFARIVFTAQEAGVDAIMVACNIFAPHIDTVKPFISVPILAVDSAMQQIAASIGGRIGIIGTNMNSVPACSQGILAAAERLAETGGQTPSAPISFCDGTVNEAAAVLENGDGETFDRMLTQKALELVEKEHCNVLVLAQITTARAKTAILDAGITVPVLTTPEEGAKALAALHK